MTPAGARALHWLRWWTKWGWGMVLWCAVTGSPVLWWALVTTVPSTLDSYRKGYLE